MLPAKDKELVDRLLDRAAELVDQVDDEHPWGNACRRTRGYSEVQQCLRGTSGLQVREESHTVPRV
ncbi:hypothetical protein [Streptosporangium sp. NPDC001681]|uniref:hypothetical protein n=1 Tax=Streptosporangium sp. NPDC001681 TaxID=3154395 RepID=UPI003325A66B